MILFRKVDNWVRSAFFDLERVLLEFGERFEAAEERAEALGFVAHDELETAAIFREGAEGLGGALGESDAGALGLRLTEASSFRR